MPLKIAQPLCKPLNVPKPLKASTPLKASKPLKAFEDIRKPLQALKAS